MLEDACSGWRNLAGAMLESGSVNLAIGNPHSKNRKHIFKGFILPLRMLVYQDAQVGWSTEGIDLHQSAPNEQSSMNSSSFNIFIGDDGNINPFW